MKRIKSAASGVFYYSCQGFIATKSIRWLTTLSLSFSLFAAFLAQISRHKVSDLSLSLPLLRRHAVSAPCRRSEKKKKRHRLDTGVRRVLPVSVSDMRKYILFCCIFSPVQTSLIPSYIYWHARHVSTSKNQIIFSYWTLFKCEINDLVFKLGQNRIFILYKKKKKDLKFLRFH